MSVKTKSKVTKSEDPAVWVNLCILLMRKLKSKKVIITAQEFIDANLGDSFIDVAHTDNYIELTLKNTVEMIEVMAERNKKDIETKVKMRQQ